MLLKEWGKSIRVELSPRIFIGISSGLDVARSPTFSPMPDVISSFFEEKWKNRKLDIECRPQVGSLF
jgi:hypothetical protein